MEPRACAGVGGPTRLEVAVGVGDALFTAALGTGAFAAVLGVAGYRRVMRRPWPPARPPADDDDW